MLPGELILLIWPVVVFGLMRTLHLKTAIIASILAGYLLLPSAFFVFFDLPLLPPINKTMIPALSAAVLGMLIYRERMNNEQLLVRQGRAEPGGYAAGVGPVQPGLLPKSVTGRSLLVLMVLSTIMTVVTNGDTLVYGPSVLEGLPPSDSFKAVINLGIAVLPMLIGRKYLADDASHYRLVWLFCLAACLYALLSNYEVRMSPQLNLTFYGFFSHSWLQHFRAGGWRPLVFLDHGLLLGIFLACGMIGTAALFRISKGAAKLGFLAALLWVLVSLYLAKTVGALIIGGLLTMIVLFVGVRLQLLAAAGIAVITLTYPMLRGADLVPTDEIVAFAQERSPERAQSLGFRFENEDILLGKANERPLFGWGRGGRSRVFNEDGEDIAITDGSWVITMGVWGWGGYISQYGFLTAPLILLALRRRHYRVGLATSGLGLMMAANLVDLLPNASLSPLTWLMAGAITGRLEIRQSAGAETESEVESTKTVCETRVEAGAMGVGAQARQQKPQEERTRRTQYTRFEKVKSRNQPDV